MANKNTSVIDPTQVFLGVLLREHVEVRELMRQLGVHSEQVLEGRADLPSVRALLQELENLDLPHHVRESAFLFPRLRDRCPALTPVLHRLKLEHERIEPMYRQLARLIEQANSTHQHEVVAATIKQFVAMVVGHMDVEEGYIFPVAADYLMIEDWTELGVRGTTSEQPNGAGDATN